MLNNDCHQKGFVWSWFREQREVQSRALEAQADLGLQRHLSCDSRDWASLSCTDRGMGTVSGLAGSLSASQMTAPS